MIVYKNGDLLKSDCNVICHQSNCAGGFGRGIAGQIRSYYPEVYEAFRKDFEAGGAVLGNVLAVGGLTDNFCKNRTIVNMYAQKEYYPRTTCHTNYGAFKECIRKVKEMYKDVKDAKIGFPDHIGCGLAGGDWSIVKQILEEAFEGPEWNIEIWKLLDGEK